MQILRISSDLRLPAGFNAMPPGFAAGIPRDTRSEAEGHRVEAGGGSKVGGGEGPPPERVKKLTKQLLET